MIEIKPFNRAATDVFWSKWKLPGISSERAYLLTGGNPLLLHLLALAVANRGAEILQDEIRLQTEEQFIKHMLVGSVGSDVLPLLEAASLIPVFDAGVLQAMMGPHFTQANFDKATRLPFIEQSKKGWYMHDLVRYALSAGLKNQFPQEYREYKRRAYRYYREEENRNPHLAHEMRILRFSLCDSEIVRTTCFAGFTGKQEDYRILQAEDSDLKEFRQCWLESWGRLVEKEMKIEEVPEYNDLDNLLSLGSRYFRVLKSADGSLLGYHATLPVCGETWNYLCHAPAMASYFSRLSPAEKNKYRSTSARDADTYVIRHLVPRDLKNMVHTGYLLRDILLNMLKGSCLITSAPAPEFKRLSEEFGFYHVPEILDEGFRHHVPVLMLDLRHISVDVWFEWLILGAQSPDWMSTLLQMTPQQWTEEVRRALTAASDIESLGKSRLAPLSAAVCGGINASLLTCSPAVLGKYLMQWLEINIINMMEQKEAEKGKRYLESELGLLLKLTYFEPLTHAEAAQKMGLSEITYYRWLRQAWKCLAGRLRDSASQSCRKMISQQQK